MVWDNIHGLTPSPVSCPRCQEQDLAVHPNLSMPLLPISRAWSLSPAPSREAAACMAPHMVSSQQTVPPADPGDLSHTPSCPHIMAHLGQPGAGAGQ